MASPLVIELKNCREDQGISTASLERRWKNPITVPARNAIPAAPGARRLHQVFDRSERGPALRGSPGDLSSRQSGREGQPRVCPGAGLWSRACNPF